MFSLFRFDYSTAGERAHNPVGHREFCKKNQNWFSPEEYAFMTTKNNVVFLGFFLFGLFIFYPALSSYFFTDDFVFLAISRYVHNPLTFFNSDHFPGGVYYRPLGILSWWLSYKLFGTQHVLHNFVNIMIHIGNSYVLFRIFGLIRANLKLNILLALLFLVHPLTISTSMWLSDRFDLLATLFVLFTIYSFLRYRLESIRAAYYSALVACVLASLSKELAYFTPLLVTIIAWYVHPNAIQTWRIKLSEIAPFYGAVLLVFAARFMVLRGTKLFLGGNSLFTVLKGGVLHWLHLLPNFYTFHAEFAHRNVAVGILLLAAILILAGLSLWALFMRRDVNWSATALALGLTLILVPAILQAPVTFSSLAYHSSGGFDVDNLIGSRFYYLSFVGFLLVAQPLLTGACSLFINPISNLIAPRLVYVLLILQIIAYGALSHSLGHRWSNLTNGQARNVVEHVSLALEPLSLPQNGCKLYILNTPSDSLYFREYSDAIIKAIAPEQSRIIHCLILTERMPWVEFVLREDMKQIAPLRDAVAPMLVDGLAFMYLNRPNSAEIVLDPNAMFIEYDGEKYVDVSLQVKSGSKRVNFF